MRTGIMPVATLGFVTLLVSVSPAAAQGYVVVDTNQSVCYDDDGAILSPCPSAGTAFHGQDAQYDGVQPAYQDNGDGTITDFNTGLMWQQTPSASSFNWQQAVDYCEALILAGYADWRIPDLKELFAIGDFSQGWPYLDSDYFDIAGQVVSKDEQFWTSNYYVGTTHGGAPTALGVNHGTGHIKGYPAGGGGPMGNYVRCVRGESCCANDFVDNGDGTVTDTATGLMWQQADSGIGLDWEAALAYAENLELAGHDDWRLPDIKELQSIVDYTHSPNATDPADEGPAIDTDFFDITALAPGTTDYEPDYGYFWSSTSAYFGPPSPEYYYGWYVAFGTATNDFGEDVHGAGAVRFDTKVEGGPAGEGGERIYNYVRAVRDRPITPCEIRVDDAASTRLRFLPECPVHSFQVVTGLLSELVQGGDFSRASCLGTFEGEGDDTRPAPSTDEGYYYLAKGLDACASRGYGEAHGVTPDPRDDLEVPDPCP